jgi:hypothetical protein
MSEYFPLRGICLACQSGAVCDTHQSRAILECASFEALDEPRISATAGTVTWSSAPQVYHGLCRDCEIRHACGDTGRAGGVWNCDQYR